MAKYVKTEEGYKLKTGEGTAGKEYIINDAAVIAGEGAEIFNDYTDNIATGYYSHAEGIRTTASGDQSHAEGYGTEASGTSSHAEGWDTTASGRHSHAEGAYTTASGRYSHAEGSNTTASEESSHAEGFYTTASASYSHAEGNNTTALGLNSHVQGRFNVVDTNNTYVHIVGNGESDVARSNAHTLDWDGNAWFAGEVYIGGTAQSEGKQLVTKEYVDEMLGDIEALLAAI